MSEKDCFHTMTKTERIFTPRRHDSHERYRMHLSEKDWQKIGRGKRWQATIVNLDDGRTFKVAGASCGIPECFCDAIVTKELIDDQEGSEGADRLS